MTDCVRCSKRDYDQIVSELAAFWGDDRMRALHHPMFLNEFGDCAHVVREDARGCRQLRAITSPQNTGSIRFHRSLGFVPVGEPGAGGVPVVKDYGGPGVDRVVLEKPIGPGNG